LFEELTVHLDTFNTVNLQITNRNGVGFQADEYCFQSSNSSIAGMHAAGLLVSANSTFMQLKNIYGQFSNLATSNHIIGLNSGTTADVVLANTLYITKSSDVELISESKSNATAYVSEVFASNTAKIKLTNVSGRFDANDTIFDATTNASANVTAMYTANNTVDSTTDFGLKFSQIVRLTLTQNSSPFTVGELITQDTTLASGELFDGTSDLDLTYNNMEGIGFNIGDQIKDASGAVGTCIFNYFDPITGNGYLRLTSISDSANFIASHRINNSIGVSADILTKQSVLLLKNAKTPLGKFQNGNFIIRGSISKSQGRNTNPDNVYKTIIYPDLVRNSGKVVYLENVFAISRTPTSKEQINLIIKF
jgi:hypothetical protein